MKFSHSLQFNSVPEWRDEYLDYSHLKKTIYTLEKGLYDALSHPPPPTTPYRDEPDANDIENESAALMAGSRAGADAGTAPPAESDPDRVFVPLLDGELRKICAFYREQDQKQGADVDHVVEDVKLAEQEELALDSDEDDDSDDEDDGHPAAGPTRPTPTDGTGNGNGTGNTTAAAAAAGYSSNRLLPPYTSRRSRRRSSESSAHGDHALSLAYDHSANAHARAALRHPTDPRHPGSAGGRSRTTSSGPSRKRTASSGSWNLPSLGGGSGNRRDRSHSIARMEASSTTTSGRYGSIWEAEDDYAIDVRITFKRRLTDLFVSLSELQQFVQLNRLGIKKILKKYDKIMGRTLKEGYLTMVVDKQWPFTESAKSALQARISMLIELYARVNTHGNPDLALNQLKTHLREEVVWQRNTVWREMIGIERKAAGATLGRDVMGTGRQEEDQAKPVTLTVPMVGRVTLPSWVGLGTFQLLVALAVFLAVLKLPLLRFFDRVEEQNCLALLALCTVLWATEVIPLFVTSFLVPFLVVILRVARSDDQHDRRLSADETAKWIFLQMFAPNMCLLLGGFTLAAVLSKYGIDKVIAVKVLRLAGTRPSTVLLAHMAVAAFAAMWVSNVAAPVLMFSLIQPILRTLPVGSPYARALIMGIALASNIGGQTSPIASPQNLIALQYMNDPVGWLQWFAIALPVSSISVVVVWLFLLRVYGSGQGVVIRKVNPPSESFSRLQWFIASVCVGTILLWCIERKLEFVLGDMGVVALLPIIIFFGTGILSKEDFNNFLWTVLFLAMGGIALGKAVTASGLLESLDDLIQSYVKHMSLAQVLISLLSISLVVATFISHTIAAVLLIPIAAQVGESLDVPHPRLLIMATTLAASAAMGLPVSGFPNMTAASLEDSMGERYLAVKDFLKSGLVATVLCGMVIATVGVLIMIVLGL